MLYLKRFSKIEKDMAYLHGLPKGWERMQYKDFLKERSKLITNIIKCAYERLPQKLMRKENRYIKELLGYKESWLLEFKHLCFGTIKKIK